MTSLDQAFIKAFSQQGTSSVVLPPKPTVQQPKPAAPTPEPRLSSPVAAAEVAQPPISDVFRNVLATLEKPPAASPSQTKAETNRQDFAWKSEEESITGPWTADCWQTSIDLASPVAVACPPEVLSFVGTVESLAPAKPIVAEPASIPKPVAAPIAAPIEQRRIIAPPKPQPVAAPVAQAVAAPVETLRRWDAIKNQPLTTSNPQSATAPLSSFLQTPVAEEQPAPAAPTAFKPAWQPEPAAPSVEFKPAWQVDRFTWPRVCRRLITRAAEEFDRLADALLAANSQGQKVLAMAGCCQGEGATTLLLCAARRLAERGIKLVLVDADLNRPRLAKRLGVQPQIGWNETSDEDASSLNQAVIEAVANNLSLLSIDEPASPVQRTADDWSRLAPCIETLKDHYEMVLVDLGPLESIDSIDDVLGKTIAGTIDAVLLVHNPRITSEQHLATVEQELTASGIALAGLIENFVAA